VQQVVCSEGFAASFAAINLGETAKIEPMKPFVATKCPQPDNLR
jgi:hypothetical protein